MSDTSTSSSRARRSGLSVPYLAMASRKLIRGKGDVVLRWGRELTEEIGQDRFDDFEDIFLLDETHLDVELIKLARRPVSPTVLVAKTGSDLEVAVKSCDHQ